MLGAVLVISLDGPLIGLNFDPPQMFDDREEAIEAARRTLTADGFDSIRVALDTDDLAVLEEVTLGLEWSSVRVTRGDGVWVVDEQPSSGIATELLVNGCTVLLGVGAYVLVALVLPRRRSSLREGKLADPADERTTST